MSPGRRRRHRARERQGGLVRPAGDLSSNLSDRPAIPGWRRTGSGGHRRQNTAERRRRHLVQFVENRSTVATAAPDRRRAPAPVPLGLAARMPTPDAPRSSRIVCWRSRCTCCAPWALIRSASVTACSPSCSARRVSRCALLGHPRRSAFASAGLGMRLVGQLLSPRPPPLSRRGSHPWLRIMLRSGGTTNLTITNRTMRAADQVSDPCRHPPTPA